MFCPGNFPLESPGQKGRRLINSPLHPIWLATLIKTILGEFSLMVYTVHLLLGEMGNWGWRMQVLNLRKMSQSIHPIPGNFDIVWKSRKTHPHSHNIAAAKKRLHKETRSPTLQVLSTKPPSTDLFFKGIQAIGEIVGCAIIVECHHLRHRLLNRKMMPIVSKGNLKGVFYLWVAENKIIYIYVCVYCIHINICPVNCIHILHIVYCICCASKQGNVCIYIYIHLLYTSSPNDLYFWRSTLQNKALSHQNKGHLSSMYQ